MSDQNSLKKIDNEIIEQTNQEWSAWSMLGILALVSMPLCLIGAFLNRDNQSLFAIFAGAAFCLALTIVVSFKKGTSAADQALANIRSLPGKVYDLHVCIEPESEGSDSFLGLLQSQSDSFWIQFSVSQNQQNFLRSLPSKEAIPVTIQKSHDPKGAILISLNGVELTGWNTTKRANPSALPRIGE